MYNEKVLFLENKCQFWTPGPKIDLGPPMVVEIGRDNTGIIPDMFLNSGTPTAAPRIDSIAFLAFVAPLESSAASYPGQPPHEPKPMDFKDFKDFKEKSRNWVF